MVAVGRKVSSLKLGAAKYWGNFTMQLPPTLLTNLLTNKLAKVGLTSRERERRRGGISIFHKKSPLCYAIKFCLPLNHSTIRKLLSRNSNLPADWSSWEVSLRINLWPRLVWCNANSIQVRPLFLLIHQHLLSAGWLGFLESNPMNVDKFTYKN